MSSLTNSFEPQPLPKAINLDHRGADQWLFLLAAEGAALNAKAPQYQDNLIATRVLGHFLVDFWKHSNHAYGLTPYRCLVDAIASCRLDVDEGVMLEAGPGDDQAQFEKVYRLGLGYRNQLLRVCTGSSEAGCTPRSEQYESFDETREKIIEEMGEAIVTKWDAKNRALLRDGYKCMISGAYDASTYTKYPELLKKGYAEGTRIRPTQCAHLFSEPAQDSDKNCGYAATAFAILDMFGLEDLVRDLLGGDMNNLSNILTLGVDLHIFFDGFYLWLEPVPHEPNTYTLGAPDDVLLRGLPSKVTFQVDSGVLERCKVKGVAPPALPDPRLMALRAACARVANASGAAKQMRLIQEEREETRVMAEDGSTADLLHTLMLRTIQRFV